MAVSSPYRTRADLINAALNKLGVTSTNQPPEIEDILRVDNELDSQFRQLAGLEIVFVADRGQPGPTGGNIPGDWFFDLSVIIADLNSDNFGLQPQDAADLRQRGLGATPGSGTSAMSLKKITRGKYTGETLGSVYF